MLTATALFATTAFAHATAFDWENLQSDIHGVAEHTDPNVVNPWGIALSSSGNVWVNDNGAGVATVYDQDGTAASNSTTPRVVTIPPSATNNDGANPTGIVANSTSFFKITKGINSQPARFIFVSEDGMISGWNPNVESANAVVAKDNGATGAVYKGATIGVSGGHNFLYVANFHANKVETYNENFVLQGGFPFTDPTTGPNAFPSDFAPFDVRNFNGRIYVTYAEQNPPDNHDDLAGPGHGFINVFDTAGHFIKRLVSRGNLNSPWGMEIVNGALWVGNFGDGHINVYDPNSGSFLGTPRDVFGTPLAFDGLWGLFLGDGRLFFTAGIVDEAHGIFGVIFSVN
ncbi:MAG TPA: TIGR03118 family protein [Chthoniobacterales bacterium]|nr:TIGR03118 family protein [Chthoniobacterales bacterium]